MKVLVFGATGSADGSVLNVCLEAPVVDEVQVVTRRPLTKAHAKLQATTEGIRNRIIENPEIRAMARRAGPSISGADK